MPLSNDAPVLGTHERVLWTGSPKPGIWLEPGDAFAIPFSVVWLGIVLTISGAALFDPTAKSDPVAALVLPLFILFGCYFLFGRFVMARFTRSRTKYYLTDRRAIIRSGIFRRSEQSVNLTGTSEVTLGPIKSGFATIEFGTSNPFYRMLPRSWSMGQSRMLSPAFEKIADAERVYRMILDTQHPAKPT